MVWRLVAESGEMDFAWIWCLMRAEWEDCVQEVWRCESWSADLVPERVKSVLTSCITYSAGFV